MLTVTGIRKNRDDEGNEFISLIIESQLTMVRSKSGTFYASRKKTSVYSTLDEESARLLIGTKLEGSIVKEPCASYTYTLEDGREIEMDYRWVYSESPQSSLESPKMPSVGIEEDSGIITV